MDKFTLTPAPENLDLEKILEHHKQIELLNNRVKRAAENLSNSEDLSGNGLMELSDAVAELSALVSSAPTPVSVTNLVDTIKSASTELSAITSVPKEPSFCPVKVNLPEEQPTDNLSVQDVEQGPYEPDIDKMYTYLRGYCVGAGLSQSLKALQFAREAHKDQKRKGGIPYIVHPLSMACFAAALELRDDNILSTILLHDVPEDCGIPVESLPVNEVTKRGIKYMTICPLPTDKNKIETKRRYFNELLESKEAIICKAIDRYMNLSDATWALSADAIGKNCAETVVLLLPVLKQAKEKWPELANLLFVLRTIVRNTTNLLIDSNQKEYTQWYHKYHA